MKNKTKNAMKRTGEDEEEGKEGDTAKDNQEDTDITKNGTKKKTRETQTT